MIPNKEVSRFLKKFVYKEKCGKDENQKLKLVKGAL